MCVFGIYPNERWNDLYCIHLQWMGQLPKHEEKGEKRTIPKPIYTSRRESKPIHSMYSIVLCVLDIHVLIFLALRFTDSVVFFFILYCRFALYWFNCCKVWKRASVLFVFELKCWSSSSLSSSSAATIVVVITFGVHACVCVFSVYYTQFKIITEGLIQSAVCMSGDAKREIKENQMFVPLSSTYRWAVVIQINEKVERVYSVLTKRQ